MCLLAGEDHPLWRAEETPLYIERGDYILTSPLPDLQIAVVGENKKGGVTLFNNSIHYFQGAPARFVDMAGLYSKFAYNSRAGFALGTRDLPSFDNMISLATRDGTMVSHRGRIIDPAYDDGIFTSSHVPFANDEETKIKTWLIPLRDGYHVRIHKVKLSREYSVTEGGFSVGVWSDEYSYSDAKHAVSYGDFVSMVDTVSNIPVKYYLAETQPGMYSHKPYAVVPCYRTATLAAGEYVFATSVGFSTDGSLSAPPTITLGDDIVTVSFGDIHKTVSL